MHDKMTELRQCITMPTAGAGYSKNWTEVDRLLMWHHVESQYDIARALRGIEMSLRHAGRGGS